jgi:hypothetical protein
MPGDSKGFDLCGGHKKQSWNTTALFPPPCRGGVRGGVEIEYVRSPSLVPPSVRVLLGRMPRTTTAYPLRVQAGIQAVKGRVRLRPLLQLLTSNFIWPDQYNSIRECNALRSRIDASAPSIHVFLRMYLPVFFLSQSCCSFTLPAIAEPASIAWGVRNEPAAR